MIQLSELPVNKDYVLEDAGCRLLIEEPIAYSTGMVELGGDGGLVFATAGKGYGFRMTDPARERRAAELLRRGFVCLAEKRGGSGAAFSLRMVFFASREYLGTLDIVLSGKVLEQLRRHTRTERLEDISGGFGLQTGVGKFFAYSVQDYRPKSEDAPAQEADSEEDDRETEGPGRPAEKLRAMRLYGRDCVVTARLEGEGLDAYLVAVRVRFSSINLPCTQLAEGTLRFTSEREYASGKVREALHSSPGYIRLWDEYSDKEGEFLLRTARAVGVLHLERGAAAVEGGNVAVPVGPGSREALRWIQEGDCIQFSGRTPAYLEDEDMTWQDWRELGFRETMSDGSATPEQRRVVHKREGTLVLEGQKLPGGVASLSIHGDKTRLQRREKARAAIRNGRAANPMLGFIIEGKPYRDASKRRGGRHYEPLSALVREKIFSHEPTPTQRRAIEIALNTPDIAIIQGPPGTGKTTVIIAILERLNELADKSSGVRGEVLVTSLQHDAVINIQERLWINSLPTVKFGRSSKQEQEGEFDLATESWCMARVEKLREKHLSLRQGDSEARLQRLSDLYVRSPGSRSALELLRCAAEVNTSTELDGELQRLIAELDIREREDDGRLAAFVRRLRTTRAAFLDDGAENAMQLYDLLEEVLEGSGGARGRDQELLRLLRTAASAAEPTPELLARLAEAKAELLGRCIPMPFYRRESPRQDVLELCGQVRRQARPTENEADRILADYLAQLEYNPASVRESLKNYCFVFTSTLQQSEGREIRLAKGDPSAVEYDTVVVDEAARANPGDLMIPLAQARSRIILVGDHRQLPHIYDEDIFEELQGSGAGNEADIKISMFQHLLENAKKLERADGIPRSISLDAQHRMHPELGDFVSRMFYEEYGEGFASPRPAGEFRQPFSSSPVMWLDCPASLGPESRSSTKSRYRLCEAEAIVRRLISYMNHPDCGGLRFGVISFYSAQVQEIRRLLARSRDQKIAAAMRSGDLRVGSVDSFQGMEFDVIFLSVVRSGYRPRDVDFDRLERDVSRLPEDDPVRREHEEYVGQVGRAGYGFLTSRNRLCVALSRQMRLLIAVGDSAMFSGGQAGRAAAQCVPAMAELYRMCQERGTVTECRG